MAYLLLIRFILIFSYSIDLDGAEFTFIHYIQQCLKGESLYLNPESFPYSITIYTPLYLEIVKFWSSVFSVDYIFDIHRIFIIGRVVSFLFTIICLYFIFRFAIKQTKHIQTSLFISTLFLVLMTGHAFATRPDSLKILFFIVYVYYFTDYFFETEKKSSKFISISAAILAIAAKQDAVVYILLIQGICLIIKWNKKITFYIIQFVILLTSLFFLFHIVYGPYCLKSLFSYNLQAIKNYRESYNFLIVLFNSVRLFPFYLLFVYLLITYRKYSNYQLIKLLSLSGIAAAVLSSIFLFRPGSYLNYTYELIVLCILSFSLFLKYKSGKKTLYFGFIYIIFIIITNTILNIYTINFEKEKKYKAEYDAYFTLRKQLKPYLENEEIIFDLTLKHSLFIADYNVIYGHEYHLDRLIFALLGLKSNSELISSSKKKYDALFANGNIDYILTQDTENEKIILQQYYPNYKAFQKVSSYMLYKPLKKY